MTPLHLPQELTHNRAGDWLKSLVFTMQQEPGRQITADASRLEHFDSSALAVLLACRREALAVGKSFGVAHMPDKLRQLAEVYGVSDLLRSVPCDQD
jgi:phospholipid transport system transporter-binding protein